MHVSTLGEGVGVSLAVAEAGVGRDERRGGLHSAVVHLALPTAQPPNRNPRSVPLHHLSAALSPHLQIQPALNNAEEVLNIRPAMRSDAAVQPADGAEHGLADAGAVGRGGDHDVVQLHDDVAADRVLQRDGVLGREQHGAVVVRG